MERGAVSVEGDSLQVYLRSIARHRNLTPAQEGRLAIRIRRGDETALQELVRANLRFVVNVAKSYQNQGLALADLINEGNLGLIRAARRFDEKKNFKFITYAVWWIRQSILKALAEQSRIVKLPLNRVGTLYKIGQTQLKLERAQQRKPDATDIAAELGITEREVCEALGIGSSAVSLDTPLMDDGEVTLGDCLCDDTTETADERMVRHHMVDEVAAVLAEMDKRDREILKLYFGIGDNNPCTLEDIGKQFKLTRERTRQLKQRALTRLKNSPRRARLHSYIH